MSSEELKLGLAGRLARAFIQSHLTPILAVAAILLGVFAVINIPREEEPQINVPMFDVFVPFPGASPKEVEDRIVRLGERKLWEIPDVEYIYTTSEPGFALFIVRFKVGTNPETAMTRIYTKLFANLDLMPPGAMEPVIKPRSIDDVPIVSLTLTGSQDPLQLRRAAAALREEINSIPDVSITNIIGGKKRQFLVHFDSAALAQRHLTPLDLVAVVQSANVRFPGGYKDNGKKRVIVETDSFITSAQDLGELVVGVSNGNAVQLREVASIDDGPDEQEREVTFNGKLAVTLAISKRPGSNATQLAEKIITRSKRLMNKEANSLTLHVTRNYGQTAKEKSDELLFHVLLATVSVTLLIGLVLGWREGIVVLIAIPVTLALTLFIYYLAGYTLNRITLFALIFSIGILVDDAIVVVENIHRHYVVNRGKTVTQISIEAVGEVGNPTVLATWTVIAAILPMAFVGGLMGPYMRPIPVGASVAMIFSLGVAFIISPWTFSRLLNKFPVKGGMNGKREGKLDQLYRRLMSPLLSNKSIRGIYFLLLLFLLFGAILLLPLKNVVVKMLPFDDKDEFEVVLNLPEDSSLAGTREAARTVTKILLAIPEVQKTVSYVGTASPSNFNGLVRHYFLRQRPYQAQIKALLVPRHDRRRQSHRIATDVRQKLKPVIERYHARIQVAEVPPGPPVLSTIVLEIYGPDQKEREALAQDIRALFQKSESVTDVDLYVPASQPKNRFRINRVKASLNGISPLEVSQTISASLQGVTMGIAHVENEKEPVEIRIRLPKEKRRGMHGVESVILFSRTGQALPIRKLSTNISMEEDHPIYHKNLIPVTYVIADVSGSLESPVYALLNFREKISLLAHRKGIPLKQHFAHMPKDSNEWAIAWDGEWHVTYSVFRDLGISFALVLVLMYILIVYWFESFTVPIVIMAPIPLTLVGILPAHWGLGAFFTATSMIGFIAGAGIVVRNSIILVDFIQLRLREGYSLEEAVIDAGAVRFRPMLLTAAAVAVGAGVILFDPIFQGLAISLIAGEVASTFLSRTAVPVLYHLFSKNGWIQS